MKGRLHKKGLLSLMVGVIIGATLASGSLSAYFWQNKLKKDNMTDFTANPASDITFVPIDQIGNLGVTNIDDFRGFAIKSFGVDRNFANIPVNAVILYKLKEIEMKLDGMSKE